MLIYVSLFYTQVQDSLSELQKEVEKSFTT